MTGDNTCQMQFTERQLDAIEEVLHETTLFYCNLCDKWFESREEALKHYEPRIIQNMFNGDEPDFELYCDHSAGNEAA